MDMRRGNSRLYQSDAIMPTLLENLAEEINLFACKMQRKTSMESKSTGVQISRSGYHLYGLSLIQVIGQLTYQLSSEIERSQGSKTLYPGMSQAAELLRVSGDVVGAAASQPLAQ